MRVLRAASAGFCFGVSLALRRLDQEIEKNSSQQAGVNLGANAGGSRLITFGPIIHNPLVMLHYEKRGVICKSDPADIGERDRVIVRAHGIPRDVERKIAASGAHIIDATCPKVKKAQTAIRKQQAKGGVLLLFGERDHPEVRGLLSYAGSGARVFATLEDARTLEISPHTPYFLAAQTTQERSLFQQALHILSNRLGHAIPALDTICDATRGRQQEVIDLTETVQAVVVVGGRNSGNTRRLAEVALARGVPALHVEQVSDITAPVREAFFRGISTVGLTAGASTPKEHIDAMQDFLERL